MQNLILAKYFNSFLQFLFLIKPTKKFSFEPKLKDQKIELVCESSFLYYWKKWAVYHIWYIMKSRTYPGKNKTMKYMWKINFSLKNQILLLVCSIKIENLWKAVSIISVYILFIFNIRLLFVTKEKTFPQQNFRFPPLGGISPTP